MPSFTPGHARLGNTESDVIDWPPMSSRRATLLCSLLCAATLTAASHAAEITVQPGDNLWSLARAHDTTVAELMAANDLTTERLSLGQVLRLPTVEVRHTYTVQPSDTLFDIARTYGVTVASIQAANDLTSDTIRPGQALLIIGGEAPVPEPAPTAAAAEAPAPEPAPEPAAEAALDAAPVSEDADAAPASEDAEATVASEAAEVAEAATETPPQDAEAPAAEQAEAPPAVEPSEAEAAAAAEPSAPLSYTVQPADTLYDIARAHGVSVDDLIAWNDLDGTLIRPGQALVLGAAQDRPAPQPLVVTVQPGDNLWTLARSHDTTVAAIASTNAIDPQATLRLGQTLTIPGRYAAVAAADGSAPSVGGPAATELQVGPGESLWTIARRHGTTVAALMELNGLTSDRLQVGQSLRVLPGNAPSQALAAAAAPQATVPSSGMVWPLVGQITSRFGYRRLRIGGTNMHYGVDIDGNVGDPIRSATAGTVTFSGWRGGFGYLVIVENGNTEYYYAHASQLLVSVGQQVEPGQLIARVGATGNVTGPHLHFEIRVEGTPVDPLPILEARATR